MAELEPIYEEGDELGAEESWLEGDWVLSNDGDGTPRCTSDVGAGPSHTAGHEDTVLAQTMSRGASTDYEDPSRMLPTVFSGFAHDDGCIFVPTLGMPTPPLMHVEPTIGPSSRIPHEEAYRLSRYRVRTLSRWRVYRDCDALLRTLPIVGPVMVCNSSTLPIFLS